MTIRNFHKSDINDAKCLAGLTWGDFFKNQSEELQKLIHDFTFDYYDLNREFSFSAFDDDFCGFLLACKKSDTSTASDKYLEMVKTLPYEEQKIAIDTINFFKECTSKTRLAMCENDIMLGLFVSAKRGFGKKLLSELKKTSLKNNLKTLYLWSDTTCDYVYYIKHDFELVDEMNFFVGKNKIRAMIFKKEFEKL